MPSRRSLPARLGGFFAVDADWSRPVMPIGRRDVLTAVGFFAASAVFVELSRSLTYFEDLHHPMWLAWLAVAIGSGMLAFRRRYPISTATVAALHLFVVGVTMPMVMGHISMQVAYFCAYYSAAAWARDRKLMLAVLGIVTALLLAWVVYQFALGNAIQNLLSHTDGGRRTGLIPPIPASVLITFGINLVYFGGAITLGQIAWRSARQSADLTDQAATIAAQAELLQRRAVVEERLRIARELHDVVAHHVSVIGVQAAAARRVLTTAPDTAETALGNVERSSREAVEQMRGLLGTLRMPDSAQGAARREPEPGLAQLDSLIAERRGGGLDVAFDLVEEPAGAANAVPPPMGLTIYRTVQEALANVARHSTATLARVTVRVVGTGPRPYAEVEVLDNGRPRAGSSGSGLGQLGLRERVASHKGEVEIGPRATGGYRVRVRLPIAADEESRPDSGDPIGRWSV